MGKTMTCFLMISIILLSGILFVDCSSTKSSYKGSGSIDTLGFSGRWVIAAGSPIYLAFHLENNGQNWKGYFIRQSKHCRLDNIIINGSRIQFTILDYVTGEVMGFKRSSSAHFEGIMAKRKNFIMGKITQAEMASIASMKDLIFYKDK